MNRDNKSFSVIRFIAIGCGAIITIILATTLYLILQSNDIDRQDYGRVAWAFADSFVDNDIETATSLAIPSQWGRIDTWMTTHTPFPCPFSWDPDNVTIFGSGRPPDVDDITAAWSYTYRCAEKGYSLSIDEIILGQTENGWIVIEWSRVCESWDWGSTRKCE